MTPVTRSGGRPAGSSVVVVLAVVVDDVLDRELAEPAELVEPSVAAPS